MSTRIKRRQSRVYTDDSPESSRAICSHCLDEYETTVKTVPYIMKDGRPDSHFRFCNNCSRIIPIAVTRHLSETQPLGGNSIGKVSFEVLERSKRRRIQHSASSTNDNEVFNLDDYKLAGQEDKDLRYFANQGFIISVNDSGNDSEEDEEY